MKRKIKFACVAIRSGDEMDCLRCDYPGGGECPVGCFQEERALYVKAIDGGKLLKQHYNKEYYEKNREMFLSRAARYREAHRELLRERDRQYREAHREQVAKRKREYYEKNKARILMQQREYRAGQRKKENERKSQEEGRGKNASENNKL